MALPLDRLLTESDFISLHLLLNGQSSKMFDKRTLLKIQWDSELINTSRFAILDESALVE